MYCGPVSVLNDDRRSRCLIQYFAFAINISRQHTGPSWNSMQFILFMIKPFVVN